MKSLVFPRIFLHCVALGFIVSGLLLSETPQVRFLSGTCGKNRRKPDFSRVSGIFPFRTAAPFSAGIPVFGIAVFLFFRFYCLLTKNIYPCVGRDIWDDLLTAC